MNDDKINYDEILEKYPWLLAENQNAIISPDADGMLCGLFMSHFLGWKIVGHYDNGKNLILKKGMSANECVFLDSEIYRSNIKSIGHHISLFRQNNTNISHEKYKNCLNPNTLRGRTLKEKFSSKYPMGTIHLLLCVVSQKIEVEYLDKSFFVILQADGTINRFLDRYSENLFDWLKYLRVDDANNILNKILKKETNLIELNEDYVEYIKNFVKEKKDKIPISERGELKKESFEKDKNRFSAPCIKTTIKYLNFLSENTGWNYKKEDWIFDDLVVYEFTKKIVRPGVNTFNRAVEENFLSLAITAADTMEYTLETPDKLP